MAIYNPKSMKAEEFINDAEILDTLRYAEENKDNIELIDKILDKARPRRTENGVHCEGLTHREASVLLACQIPDQARILRQPNCYVCSALSFQLLRKRLRLLSLSYEE